MAEEGKPATKRARSPSYPAVNLERALELAATFFKAERGNEAPIKTVLTKWGYSETSGGGLVALSALIKFGLLADQGTGTSRKVRLTPTARRILLDERPNSEERLRLIKEAALTPTIYRELWDKYGSELPSDENLRYHLRVERGFEENAAASVIRDYKHTLAFAKLLDADTISPSSEDKGGFDEGTEMVHEPRQPLPGSLKADQNRRRPIHLPLPGTDWATLEAPFPLTSEVWEHMMRVLEAMKPALIRSEKKILTQAAQDLVRKADEGGIPTYMSDGFERIAQENGIQVSDSMTPGELIDALRAKAQETGPIGEYSP